MNRNSGKKESSVENSERSTIGTFHELLLFLKMEPKIGCLLKAFAAKNGWNGTRLEFVTDPIERRCVMGKKSA